MHTKRLGAASNAIAEDELAEEEMRGGDTGATGETPCGTEPGPRGIPLVCASSDGPQVRRRAHGALRAAIVEARLHRWADIRWAASHQVAVHCIDQTSLEI